jgi:hypothetical protein
VKTGESRFDEAGPRHRPFGGRLAAALILAAALLAGPATAAAQLGGGGDSGNRIEGRARFLPIPYANYDRSIGLQGGALPMLLFNPVQRDTISPSSMASAFGMYSTNDTWFLSAFAKVHLAEDDWRLATAWGTGSYNFQFYVDSPIDAWIPYNTRMDIGLLQVQRRIWQRLYLGVSYVHLEFETAVDSLPVAREDVLDGLGLNLDLDRRHGVYYPRGGSRSRLRYSAYPEALGNDDPNARLELETNVYRTVGAEDVAAARFFAGAGVGDLTFNQQFVVGGRQDLRGYTQGEYRGDYLVAVQGEYRWNFHDRFGAVGFGGVATVFGALNDDDDGTVLPAIGTGIRFTADLETNLNVGIDIAVGRGDWGLYFKFGEAF